MKSSWLKLLLLSNLQICSPKDYLNQVWAPQKEIDGMIILYCINAWEGVLLVILETMSFLFVLTNSFNDCLIIPLFPSNSFVSIDFALWEISLISAFFEKIDFSNEWDLKDEKDAVDENGNPVYQGVDSSFLIPTLVKAIQELKAEIDLLKGAIKC